MAIKVLILDDEKEILDSMRRLLELDSRLEVLTVYDPEKALALITKENIQIVFCDIVMPKMDGLEFLRAAKSINGLIQVIMMSAYSTVERVIQSLEYGATDYLMKPFDREELEAVVDSLIQKLERWKTLVVKARDLQDRQGPTPENVTNGASLEEALERIEEMVSKASPGLAEELFSWLETEDRQPVRERLLWALGEVLSRAPRKEILKRMLSSEDPYVRNGAIEIGRQLGEGVLPVLQELFSEGDKDLRKLVLDIAYFIPSSEVEDLFREALSDPDPNIRMTAVEYLGERGSPEVALLLEERLFKEEEPMLLATLFETLAKIGSSPRSEEIIAYFRERLDPILFHSFFKYLGAFGRETDLSWMETYLREGRLSFSRELVDAVLHILNRHPEAHLSDYFVSLFEKAALSERKSMAIYQILKLLYSDRPQKALDLAHTFVNDKSEARHLAAENFLSEVEDFLPVGESHV